MSNRSSSAALREEERVRRLGGSGGELEGVSSAALRAEERVLRLGMSGGELDDASSVGLSVFAGG